MTTTERRRDVAGAEVSVRGVLAGYKTLSVVGGQHQAYVHLTQIKKWDICAGDAILKSVGGRLTDLSDDQIEYRASSSPVLVDGLLATIKHHTKFLDKIVPAVQKYRTTGKSTMSR